MDSDLEPPAQRRRLLDPNFSRTSPAPSLAYSPSVAPDAAELDLDEAPPPDGSLGLEPNQKAELPALPPPAGSLGLMPGQDAGVPAAPPGLEETTAQPGLVEPGAIGLPSTMDSAAEQAGEPSPDSVQPPPQLDPTTSSNQPQRPQPPVPELDPYTAALYQPATDEDFAAHRRRFQQQETISFGPYRRLPKIPTPYDRPPEEPPEEANMASFDIDDLDVSALPPCWKFEDGYITLDDRNKDYWELKAGCLIRHHVVPRRSLFDPRALSAKELAHLPVPLSKLDQVRVTVCKDQEGIWHRSDFFNNGTGTISNTPWTGCTVFQLNGETRHELGLYAYSAMTAKQMGKKQKTQAQRKFRKAAPKSEVNERKLSLEDRLLFHQAKVKELKSFVDNGVWTFQTTKEADAGRTLSSRMLLK